jgi:hypothetical protein
VIATNGFAKAVGVMENNQVCDPVKDLGVGICLATNSHRTETQLQPSEFEALLHEAWLILNSRKLLAQSTRGPE